jgi:histidinol dehydrogenase
VLPTGGTPRFFSPLSVDDFVKKTQFVYYTCEALAAAKDNIAVIAEAEQLRAHGQAALVRFEE